MFSVSKNKPKLISTDILRKLQENSLPKPKKPNKFLKYIKNTLISLIINYGIIIIILISIGIFLYFRYKLNIENKKNLLNLHNSIIDEKPHIDNEKDDNIIINYNSYNNYMDDELEKTEDKIEIKGQNEINDDAKIMIKRMIMENNLFNNRSNYLQPSNLDNNN
jgi:hypothetical protein